VLIAFRYGGFRAGIRRSVSGAVKTVMPLAKPGERAGLLSAFYVEGYLSFSLPAVLAGSLRRSSASPWRGCLWRRGYRLAALSLFDGEFLARRAIAKVAAFGGGFRCKHGLDSRRLRSGTSIIVGLLFNVTVCARDVLKQVFRATFDH